jgi:phosphatidylethanolamine-binding protein (PEBP) family uncharacterized protein
MKSWVVALVALTVFGFSVSEAAAFSASFRWCSKMPQSTTSPAFALSNVPKGTSSFSLAMIDHQAGYNHGGGTVAYNGGRSIPCGAIPYGWVGPFPPNGEVHIYEFIIKALDASGGELGEARATRRFPDWRQF